MYHILSFNLTHKNQHQIKKEENMFVTNLNAFWIEFSIAKQLKEINQTPGIWINLYGSHSKLRPLAWSISTQFALRLKWQTTRQLEVHSLVCSPTVVALLTFSPHWAIYLLHWPLLTSFFGESKEDEKKTVLHIHKDKKYRILSEQLANFHFRRNRHFDKNDYLCNRHL